MSYSVKGKVSEVGEHQTSAGGFEWRTVAFKVMDGSYETELAVDFVKEKAIPSGELKVGQEVEVTFNLRSNKGNGGRWFTNVSAWKWNVVGQTAPPADTSY